MTGKTHLTVGVAAALALAFAGGGAAAGAAGVPALLAAAAGGAAGAVLPDLDVRAPAHPIQDRVARVGAAALLAGAAALDLALGGELVRAAAERGLGRAAAGAACLAALVCAVRLSAHRSFSHSLPALAGATAATWLLAPQLAPYVAAGMASHMALDMLNHRSVRLLWPARGGLALGLCKTDGVVDACLCAAGVLGIARALWAALG